MDIIQENLKGEACPYCSLVLQFPWQYECRQDCCSSLGPPDGICKLKMVEQWNEREGAGALTSWSHYPSPTPTIFKCERNQLQFCLTLLYEFSNMLLYCDCWVPDFSSLLTKGTPLYLTSQVTLEEGQGRERGGSKAPLPENASQEVICLF